MARGVHLLHQRPAVRGEHVHHALQPYGLVLAHLLTLAGRPHLLPLAGRSHFLTLAGRPLRLGPALFLQAGLERNHLSHGRIRGLHPCLEPAGQLVQLALAPRTLHLGRATPSPRGLQLGSQARHLLLVGVRPSCRLAGRRLRRLRAGPYRLARRLRLRHQELDQLLGHRVGRGNGRSGGGGSRGSGSGSGSGSTPGPDVLLKLGNSSAIRRDFSS